jgi:hypothetical protein
VVLQEAEGQHLRGQLAYSSGMHTIHQGLSIFLSCFCLDWPVPMRWVSMPSAACIIGLVAASLALVKRIHVCNNPPPTLPTAATPSLAGCMASPPRSHSSAQHSQHMRYSTAVLVQMVAAVEAEEVEAMAAAQHPATAHSC